jgi:hypothetical protein
MIGVRPNQRSDPTVWQQAQIGPATSPINRDETLVEREHGGPRGVGQGIGSESAHEQKPQEKHEEGKRGTSGFQRWDHG